MAILVCVCACSLTDLCSALCDPVCVVAHQAPLSVEFSRQGYWTGLPFLPSGDLPDPGFKPIHISCISCIGRWVIEDDCATWKAPSICSYQSPVVSLYSLPSSGRNAEYTTTPWFSDFMLQMLYIVGWSIFIGVKRLFHLKKKIVALNSECYVFLYNAFMTWIFFCSYLLKCSKDASKVMLKILQARLQQYVNRELPLMFKLVLEKAEEPEIKLPTSAGSSKKQGSSRKTSISVLLTMPMILTVWITINCGKFWKRWEYQTTWPTSWEICMQVRKQQLELNMEQQTGSK